jgi:hypothetical protein
MAGRGLIPLTRDADLTDPERRILVAVCQAPALWPFWIVAGALGLDTAMEACRARRLPAAEASKLAALGWGVERLPTYGDAKALLLGVRAQTALNRARSDARPEPSLRELADRFGADRFGVARALRVIRDLTPDRVVVVSGGRGFIDDLDDQNPETEE